MKGYTTLDIYSYELKQKSKRTSKYHMRKKDRYQEKRIKVHSSKPRDKRITYFREEDIDNT